MRASDAVEELTEERRARHETSVELERMRTVFSQLDSMREELVGKLKTKFAEVHDCDCSISAHHGFLCVVNGINGAGSGAGCCPLRTDVFRCFAGDGCGGARQ